MKQSSLFIILITFLFGFISATGCSQNEDKEKFIELESKISFQEDLINDYRENIEILQIKIKELDRQIYCLEFRSNLINNQETKMITFNTTKGPIVIELYDEESPITSKNFLEYAKSGFFDGTLFHRVIPGFVIQGGGMETGMEDKKGNQPIQNEANNCVKNLKWSLSMARTNDPHSASSQFFINLQNNESLDHTGENPQGWGYAVFGEVVDGFETVEAIAAAETGSVSFHQDVPLEEISIIDTVVTTE
jgi:peptidyl-prolyl cis-trans isomerase B (cyclophilin B)